MHNRASLPKSEQVCNRYLKKMGWHRSSTYDGRAKSERGRRQRKGRATKSGRRRLIGDVIPHKTSQSATFKRSQRGSPQLLLLPPLHSRLQLSSITRLGIRSRGRIGSPRCYLAVLHRPWSCPLSFHEHSVLRSQRCDTSHIGPPESVALLARASSRHGQYVITCRRF